MNKLATLLLTTLLLSACATFRNVDQPVYSNEQSYYQAVLDAMAPDSSKIFSELIDINPENEFLEWITFDGEDFVKMVSWKNTVSYYEPYLDSAYYNTGNYEIWVSASPQLLNRMSEVGYSDADLRLKQLLGLPPSSEYNFFVEFWVKPVDLFRPCPDNEIVDKDCELCFPSSVSEDYKSWINGNRISRYYGCELGNKYPWTQLGYTYDWNENNMNHVGLSEFVIRKNAKVKVHRILTTEQYLNQ